MAGSVTAARSRGSSWRGPGSPPALGGRRPRTSPSKAGAAVLRCPKPVTFLQLRNLWSPHRWLPKIKWNGKRGGLYLVEANSPAWKEDRSALNKGIIEVAIEKPRRWGPPGGRGLPLNAVHTPSSATRSLCSRALASCLTAWGSAHDFHSVVHDDPEQGTWLPWASVSSLSMWL